MPLIDLAPATREWYRGYLKHSLNREETEAEFIRLYLTTTKLSSAISFADVEIDEWNGKPSLRVITGSEIRCGDMRTLLDTKLVYKGHCMMLFAIHARSEGSRPEEWEEMREPGDRVQDWTFAWHELQYVIHPGILDPVANDAKSIFS